MSNSSCSGWLCYTLKRKLTNRKNPLTSKYSGMDPETASLGTKGNVTESGIDWAGYPNPRTYLFGLNLNF